MQALGAPHQLSVPSLPREMFLPATLTESPRFEHSMRRDDQRTLMSAPSETPRPSAGDPPDAVKVQYVRRSSFGGSYETLAEQVEATLGDDVEWRISPCRGIGQTERIKLSHHDRLPPTCRGKAAAE